MPWEQIRCMIWCKTYPELSSHHVETVCTGACLEDGTPIRLYPVPLRYLEGPQKYRLYDIVELEVDRNNKDHRPESRRVNDRSIKVVGAVPSDRHGWAERREWLDRRAHDWHFDSIAQLESRQEQARQSMGFITPGAIEDVYLITKPEKDRRDHVEKWEGIAEQTDAFRAEYKRLDFVPFAVKLRWRCAERCAHCRDTPHDMQVLDWGLIELGRKRGPEAARARLAALADLSRHDFKLFIGNLKSRPRTFTIIGLWYPLRRAQLELL